MKKHFLIWILSILTILTGIFVFSDSAGAFETDDDYFGYDLQIGSAEGLLAFANEAAGNSFAGKKVILIKDVTLPDGAVWPAIQNFRGTFDGGGHVISNLHVENSKTTSYEGPAGLFTSTGNGAVIRDLIIRDSSFISWFNTAPFVGRIAGDTIIEKVHVDDTVTVTGTQQIGGIVGRVNPSDSVIRNSSSAAVLQTADVAGQTRLSSGAGVGGIVGDARGLSDDAVVRLSIAGCGYFGSMDISYGTGFGGIVGRISGTPDQIGISIADSVVGMQGSSKTYYDSKVGGFLGYSSVSGRVVTVTNSYASVTSAAKNSSYGLTSNSTYYLRASQSITISSVNITSPGALYAIAKASKIDTFAGKTILIQENLDLGIDDEFPMIGNEEATTYVRFQGVIDGQGHTIRNMNVRCFRADHPDKEIYAGFVSQLEYDGLIKNLTIADSTVESDGDAAGAAVGRIANGGTVERIHVTDTVSVRGAMAGGIAGRLGAPNTDTGISAVIKECWADDSITGTTYSGGIAGYKQATGTTIMNCLFSGSVSGVRAEGGILGQNNAGSLVLKGCVSIGTIGRGQGAALIDKIGYADSAQGNGFVITSPNIADYVSCEAVECAGVGRTLFGFRNVDRYYDFTNETIRDAERFSSVSDLIDNLDEDLLDPDYWTKENGCVPMLNAFLGQKKPAGTDRTAEESNTSAYIPSLQEMFAFVPVPSIQNFTSFARSVSANVNGVFTFKTVTASEFTTFLNAFMNAGYSVYSGDYYYNPSSGRYILVTYDSENSALTLTSFPGPGNELSTANYLFSGLPTLSATPHTVDSGGNQYTRIYANQSASVHADYLSSLESLGFTKVYNNGDGLDGGNLLESVYRKGSRDVIVTYVKKTKVLYVIATLDQNRSPRLYGAAEYPQKFASTVLFMPALKQKSLDYNSAAGNSFVIRLKNGHFLISDGGNSIEADDLLNYLEEMAPAGEKPVVEGWFISHPHGDHYGAFNTIFNSTTLRERIRVNGIYHNIPSFKAFLTGGSTSEYTNNVRFMNCASRFTNDEGGDCKFYTLHTGDVYYFDDIRMEIPITQDLLPMYSEAMPNYYGSETMWRVNDLNDCSSWTKAVIEGQSFLNGGDGDAGTARFMELSYSTSYLTVTFMNMLHHGYNILQHFKVNSVNSSKKTRSYTKNVLFHVTTMLYDNEDTPPGTTGRFYGIRDVHTSYKNNITNYLPSLEATIEEHFSFTEGSRVFVFPYHVGTSKLYSDWIRPKLGDINGDGVFTILDPIRHLYTLAFPDLYTTKLDRDLDHNGTVDADDAAHLLYALYFPESYRLTARPDSNW